MTKDADISREDFLSWALEKMNMRRRGFKKVRKQVFKRINRRMDELGIELYAGYKTHLENNPGEWKILDRMTHITISRFFRDKRTWEKLADNIIPQITQNAAENSRPVRCWSAGCASGEEPYSLAILWKEKIEPAYPGISLELIATDADTTMLERAGKACYSMGSIKEMPVEWLNRAFHRKDQYLCLKRQYSSMVEFLLQDIRYELPDGKFDLVFCKNLVAMYFKKELATEVFNKISSKMEKGAFLILGSHEEFPLDLVSNIREFNKTFNIFQRI